MSWTYFSKDFVTHLIENLLFYQKLTESKDIFILVLTETIISL